MKTKHFLIIVAWLLCLLPMATSCDHINNKQVPRYTVRLNLGNYGLWNTYGVSGVGDYRYLNRAKQLPANFPYNVNSYTGYGGVLIVMGLDSGTGNYMPLAFDAACPVERDADVVVSIDPKNFEAFCPKCGSRFNVLNGAGGPIGGVATQRKVGMSSYIVRASQNGGYIITSY